MSIETWSVDVASGDNSRAFRQLLVGTPWTPRLIAVEPDPGADEYGVEVSGAMVMTGFLSAEAALAWIADVLPRAGATIVPIHHPDPQEAPQEPPQEASASD